MIADNLQAIYEAGFRGYVPDPKADAHLEMHLRGCGAYAFAGDAIADYHLGDIGKGKLSLPFVAAMQLYPHCLPGGAQGRGSCVAWSTRNAALVSYCAYILYGRNDERFTAPELSDKAIASGCFATEGVYWFRGHSGDGWQCSAAAEVAISKCGLLERRAYPELGLDLTVYSASTEGRWGGTPPPEKVQEVCRRHLCSNATVVKGWEEVRSMVASGYALSTCGSEAFSSTRDEWGVCRRTSGTWHHAMAVHAVDDRPETHAKYGCGLVGVQNSWGDYLRGPAGIQGTDKQLPVGAFWARWDDFKNRYFVALGPSKGWPASKLPDWGLGGVV